MSRCPRCLNSSDGYATSSAWTHALFSCQHNSRRHGGWPDVQHGGVGGQRQETCGAEQRSHPEDLLPQRGQRQRWRWWRQPTLHLPHPGRELCQRHLPLPEEPGKQPPAVQLPPQEQLHISGGPLPHTVWKASLSECLEYCHAAFCGALHFSERTAVCLIRSSALSTSALCVKCMCSVGQLPLACVIPLDNRK